MTVKTVIVAAALSLLPVAGFAMGCSGKEHQAQSCAQGSIWDAEARQCVKQVTG